eukprot:TRINITY_DN12595_c0_g6_i2.p1 TRINITY_DN12595_c0_g6~~TRINITY_DN12595_c0_g6_i2.p1  ORF type:complete len:314 (-),score=29.80 TRINITY_DN12595_c0_g6_i2:224-1165(-)
MGCAFGSGTCCEQDVESQQLVSLKEPVDGITLGHEDICVEIIRNRARTSLELPSSTVATAQGDTDRARSASQARIAAKWSQVAKSNVTAVADATSFLQLKLAFDGALQCCSVSPQHYILTFEQCDEERLRDRSALLTTRVVKQDELPTTVPVGSTIYDRQGRHVLLAGDHLEFEVLLETGGDPLLATGGSPWRIACGPSRFNESTKNPEYIPVDLGRCLRRITTTVEDGLDGSWGVPMLRCRWWICLALLRFVCESNGIDVQALTCPDRAPLSWAVCVLGFEPGLDNPTTRSSTADLSELSAQPLLPKKGSLH